METKKLAFLHASFRAYFCAEALLAQGYTPQQDLTGERYEEAIRFLHDLLPTSRIRTAHDLLTQLQQDWTYALHLHESHEPQALDAIEHVQHLFETYVALIQSQPLLKPSGGNAIYVASGAGPCINSSEISGLPWMPMR